ncbi:hypothetical protein SAMN04487936_10587 [Halobacillus dabanensis]|uniref:Uncharacterized protein n=1 Tax=Halobacillus dabanensis TaxID=240302 RepID=A0A1I3V445_HALDA|nr:hypothetical protein [Halobacillus dabanensis]SFJ88947.1 hypothetical protein SAMN04487936_10587 [Halobacillus dabanensis]
MFNLPTDTFWMFAPWPFFWLGLAFFLYIKLKKEDEAEERLIQNTDEGSSPIEG